MDKKIIVELVQTVSDDLISVLNNLMLQLNPDIAPLTLSDVQEILDAKNTWLFIAVDQDTQSVVGTLTLISYRTPSGVRGYVEDVVVDEKARGQGIGKLLLNTCIQKAKELRLEYIGLTSRPERVAANKLYQSFGFEKRETNVYRLQLVHSS